MNACCNNESIFLFEKLSLLPFLDVHKHLNASSLILNALFSKKWEAVIRQEGMRLELESEWAVKITEDEVWIKLKFESETKNENFDICFKEGPNLGLEKMTGDVRIHQENNLITFYHKTNQHLEDTCFKALQLLNCLFPPTSYRNINLSLGPRSPEFPFRFLLHLPHGNVEYLELHADQEVDGGALIEVLRNFKVVNRRFGFYVRTNLDITTRVKNLIKCDELAFENISARIVDARFLPNNFMKHFSFVISELGQNNFTSQDFNAFLRSWKENRGCSWWRNVAKATFDIREDQKIKMEEVMEGLKPHVGKPRIRDRWRLEYPSGNYSKSHLTATDFSDGWDIKNNQGEIGTVLLESNRLTFYNWSSTPFRWQREMKSIEESIRSIIQSIDYVNRERNIIQRKIDAGKMELFPKQVAALGEYPEQMRIKQERLALAFEVKEKLLTVWKNDKTIYVPPLRLENNSGYSEVVTILILGAEDIALDAIPISLQCSREPNGRRQVYAKMHSLWKIQIILATDVSSIEPFDLHRLAGIIYAYSDSDSFDHLSMQFVSLRKRYSKTVRGPIRQANSVLLHLTGSDRKDKEQSDPFDVDSFQRSTWSDLYEFDLNSNSLVDSDIRDFNRFLLDIFELM